jgi:DNA-binding MarR family transcriptional regulator
MISKRQGSVEAASIINSIRRVVRALHMYSREAERRFGMSAAQVFVLQQLQEGAPLSLKELAARTMTDLSSASVVVERLAKKNLLIRRRSERDGRVLELCLSTHGKLLLRQQPDPLQLRLVRSVALMTASKRKALSQGLEALLKGAGLEGEQASLFFETEDS